MNTQQEKIGCLKIGIILFICFLAFLFYSEWSEKKKAEERDNYVLEQRRKEQKSNYYIQQKETQPVQYQKPTKLTPKQKRELENEAQYEWDVREEAEEEMDERGINEDF